MNGQQVTVTFDAGLITPEQAAKALIGASISDEEAVVIGYVKSVLVKDGEGEFGDETTFELVVELSK